MFKLKKFTRKFFSKKKSKSAVYRRYNSRVCLLPHDVTARGDPAIELFSQDLDKSAFGKPECLELLDQSFAAFSPFAIEDDDEEGNDENGFEGFTNLPENIQNRFAQILPQIDYHKFLIASRDIFEGCLQSRGIEVDELTIESTYQVDFQPILIRNKLGLYRSPKFIHSPLFKHIRAVNTIRITVDDEIPQELLQYFADTIKKSYQNIFIKIAVTRNLEFLYKLIHNGVQRIEITIAEAKISWDDLLMALESVPYIRIYDWSPENTLDGFTLLKFKLKAWIAPRTQNLESFELSFFLEGSKLKNIQKLYFCNGTYC